MAQKRDLLLQKIILKTMTGVDVDIEAIKSSYGKLTTNAVIEMLDRKEIINYSYTQI